jgi:hypothetical protein
MKLNVKKVCRSLFSSEGCRLLSKKEMNKFILKYCEGVGETCEECNKELIDLEDIKLKNKTKIKKFLFIYIKRLNWENSE